MIAGAQICTASIEAALLRGSDVVLREGFVSWVSQPGHAEQATPCRPSTPASAPHPRAVCASNFAFHWVVLRMTAAKRHLKPHLPVDDHRVSEPFRVRINTLLIITGGYGG